MARYTGPVLRPTGGAGSASAVSCTRVAGEAAFGGGRVHPREA